MSYYYNLIVGLISLLLGIFVLINNRKHPQARLFFFLALANGLTTIFSAGLDLCAFHLNKPEPFFMTVFPLAGAFVPIVFLHFGLAFPQYPKWFKSKYIWLLYLPIIYFAYLAIAWKYHSNIYVKNHRLVIDLTPSYFIYWGYCIAATVVSLIINRWKYIDTQNALHRRQLNTLLLASAIGGGGLLLGTFFDFFKIDFYIPETGVLIFILLTFYAVVRYQAFDIKTAAQYFLFWCFSLVILISPIVLTPIFIPLDVFVNYRETLAAWGLFVLVYYHVINKTIIPTLNKIALRKRHQLRDEEEQFIRRLEYITDWQIIQTEVFKILHDNIFTEDIVLITCGRNGDFNGEWIVTKKAEVLNTLVWPDTNIDILRGDTINLLGNIGESLLQKNIEVVVPLVAEGRFYGILCLAQKRTYTPYLFEDIRFIKNISHSISSYLYKTSLVERASDITNEIIHEMKNTLTGLEFMVSELKKKDKLDENDKSNLDSLIFEISKLHTFSRKHLTLEMIGNQSELDLKPILVSFVLEQAIKTNQQKLIERHLTIKTEIPDNATIYGDDVLLAIVFVNLIDNAIKHSLPNQEIIITVKEDHRHTIIAVTDYGVGISEEKKKTLFKKWFRDGNGAYISFGLGLSLCSKIIEKHNGYINFESILGKKTTFNVYFPKKG